MVAQERVAQMRKWLEAAIADPDNGPLMERPERMIVAYHDGPGVQFLNAAGKPMLSEFIRDVELAVTLFNTLRFHSGAPSSHREAVFAFAEAILHGDEAHRKWLRDAATAFVDGRALPIPGKTDAT